MHFVRGVTKQILPDWLHELRDRAFGWRWFSGPYMSWDLAKSHCTGYDQPEILNKVIRATSEVKAGRAAFERDSVIFQQPAIEEDLLFILLEIAQKNNGRLRVLDFGGALGSIYWQHRKQFESLKELRWDVVEQSHFVAAGRKLFQNDALRFFLTVQDAEDNSTHDVWLASCVIQYLPEAHQLLEQWVKRGPKAILLHNLPLDDSKPDFVRIQYVPPEIYAASYPVWFFNRHRILEHFEDRYKLERAYPSTAIWRVGWRDFQSTGLYFVLKGTA